MRAYNFLISGNTLYKKEWMQQLILNKKNRQQVAVNKLSKRDLSHVLISQNNGKPGTHWTMLHIS